MSQSIKILLNESLLIKSYENELNELLHLFEDDMSRTFEWDITKERLDRAKRDVKTTKQAELFLNTLLQKITNLPKRIRIRMVRYIVMGFIGLLSMSSISNILSANAPEIKDEILISVKNNKEPTTKEVEIKTPSSVSDSLINFIKYEEGSLKDKGEPALKAYKLGDRMVTVGWGHAERTRKSKYKPGQIITRQEAEQLLKSDIKRAEDAINDVLSTWDNKGIEYNINQDMYDAMVSMAFNMGRSGFRNSDFIQLVKKGKYKEAKDEIKKTSKRSFRKFPGLKDRREKEANLFGSGLNKLNKIQG